MTSTQKIPIQNIYYLLCYAWNKLEEGKIVDVASLDKTNLMDLFAKVLINGLNHLIRRGIDRGYMTFSEDTRCLRGRICFAPSLKRNLLPNAIVNCEHDELSYNVLHNQILRSTLRNLMNVEDLSSDLRDDLITLYRKLHEVDTIALNGAVFSRVQLYQNNAFYDFLLKICALIYDNLIISEDKGESKFRDFLRDERQMSYLFEEFVRNFYRIESDAKYVGREEIPWDLETPSDVSYLPKMITDASIERNGSKTIVEVKYYKEALATHFDQEKFHSAHMYQLFAYLKNVERKGGPSLSCSGILLYPTVDKDIRFKAKMDSHKVMVRTVNLNQKWQDIHADLLDVLYCM